MSFDYYILPGEILKEYLESRNITQKQLAMAINSSERHVSQVINGKAKITEEFALSLEGFFPDTKAEFWLNLEMNYQLFLLRNKEKVVENAKFIVNKYKLKHVFKGLNYTDDEMVEEMLKITNEKSINSLENTINDYQSALYMHDGGNKEVIYLWLKLCEEQIYIQNDLESFPEFNHRKFVAQLDILKLLLNTSDYKLAFKNVKRFLNENGIGLVLYEAIPTAKIRGATTFYDDKPMIYLSIRHKRIDSVYFAIVHEIFHLVNKDYEKSTYVLSYEEDEKELISNQDARNFFIANSSLKQFKKQGKPTEESIRIFANEQGVTIDVVLGFLQRDNFIDYSEFNYLRTYIRELKIKDVYTNL